MEEPELKPDDLGVKGRKTSCTYCRKRKSKCDGRHPQCSTCIAYKTICNYDKPPSLAYVRSLEAKVESLTNQLRRLNADGPATHASNLSETSSPHLATSSVDVASTQAYDGATATECVQVGDKVGTWASEIHNSTSAIYTGTPSSNHADGFPRSSIGRTSFSDLPDTTKENQERLMLLSNAATQRHQEESIVDNMAKRGDIPREVASELLNLHWCWIHPLFLFVYRPAFIRNMAAATAGHPAPYFSDTLLRVMLGHTGRFLASSSVTFGQQLSALAERAHASLGTCLNEPSSIPTLQALLQQSAREVAFGRSSQAWLYSGMAFRMAVDLGIHLPSESLQSHLQNLTAEDVEVRKRLFWSCKNWDCVISLYFGRMPSFLVPIPNGPDFMDEYTENELWQPYYGSLRENYSHNLPPYPATEGRVVSTFTALCKLSTILSMVMLEIYGPDQHSGGDGTNSTGSKGQSFTKINEKLREWWTSLPSHLAILVNQLPPLSPPPHIVSLNLLYHTTSILLHRPFVAKIDAAQLRTPAVQKSYQICITAAVAIRELLKLQVETFGYRHITYPNSYAVYIAATIAILNYQFEEETGQMATFSAPLSSPLSSSSIGDKLGLKFFLDILQRTSKTLPASGRSVAIIRRHMQTVLEQSSKKKLATLFPNESPSDSTCSVQHVSEGFIQPESPFTAPTSELPQQFVTSVSPDAYSFTGFSGFVGEGLPAFPGQQFSVGPNYQITSDNVHPNARAAFLGQHLDPHMSLQHESNDWDSGYYMLDRVG